MLAFLIAAPLRPERTFLSPDDILGFGLGDYVALTFAVLIAALLLFWTRTMPVIEKIAGNAVLSLLIVAVIPVLLRLALLPRCPIPAASGADDFSYILLADTLRHFRLANPPHAFPAFFEQTFVLQEPTYSSMYALGQGLVLALGWTLVGNPWAGVLLSIAGLCAACTWMLRGWISPHWALMGGLLASIEFGPLSYWTNSYWGGAVSATAGCLVFGALPRIRDGKRKRDAALLGLGLAIQLLTRPFEFCLLCLAVMMFVLPTLRRTIEWGALHRAILMVGVFLVAALALTGLHNRRVTSSWTTLPYMLSRYQYGVPATFTFQPNPTPHRLLNEDQEFAYKAQSAIHGSDPESVATYADRSIFRLRFLRFYVSPLLYLAMLAFVTKLREFRHLWVVLTIALFALGSNFYPYFFPHYVAALASLFILMQLVGLERLNQMESQGNRMPIPLGSLLFLLCTVQFLFWFGMHAFGSPRLLAAFGQFESWDYINYGDPQGRLAVDQQLSKSEGKQLVFVHYAPGHQFQEWVYNDAEIDSSAVVRVHDLGPVENQKILNYYPHRMAWLLEPDVTPPRLTRYPRDSTGFQDVR